MVIFLNIVATFAFLGMLFTGFGSSVGASVSGLLWVVFGIWGTVAVGLASIVSRMPYPYALQPKSVATAETAKPT